MRTRQRVAAVAQIAGGLTGFGLLYSYVWPVLGGALQFVPLVFLSFSGLCLVAGVSLWRGEDRGRTLTVVAQLPQILAVAGPEFAFRLQAGPQVLVIWDALGVRYWAGFTAGFHRNVVAADAAYVAINLAPLLVLALALWPRSGGRQRSGPSSLAETPATIERSAV